MPERGREQLLRLVPHRLLPLRNGIAVDGQKLRSLPLPLPVRAFFCLIRPVRVIRAPRTAAALLLRSVKPSLRALAKRARQIGNGVPRPGQLRGGRTLLRPLNPAARRCLRKQTCKQRDEVGGPQALSGAVRVGKRNDQPALRFCQIKIQIQALRHHLVPRRRRKLNAGGGEKFPVQIREQSAARRSLRDASVVDAEHEQHLALRQPRSLQITRQHHV